MIRFALILAAALVPVTALAGVHPFQPESPMQREWKARRHLPWNPHPAAPGIVRSPLADGSDSPFTVLGYLPYWVLGKSTLVLRFDRLDVVAYFGAELLSDGSIGETHHWGKPELDAIVEQAHSSGVRVVLTVVNFDPDSIHAVLASQVAREAAIANLAALVKAAGGDGVNVDFEGLMVQDKDHFVGFIESLKEALDEAVGTSHLSIATPAVDWKGSFDYDALAASCDALVIMGYDYHWRNGDPGPVSPLMGSDKWGKYALDWTIADYLEWGKDVNRHKFLLGLPLYGFDWPSTSHAVPGKATGPADALFYASCQDEAVLYGWEWDEESSTPYYLYESGGYRQVWCENAVSMARKFELVRDSDIGGVGFWALGYEGLREDVWYELAHVFPEDGNPEPAPDSQAEPDSYAPAGEMAEPAPDAPAIPEVTEAPGVEGNGCHASHEPRGRGTATPVLLLLAALIFATRRSTMSSRKTE